MPPRVVVMTITLLLALQPVTTDLYLPALPGLQRALGASLGAAQLTLSALIVCFGLGQLACGPLADRFGRRPVLASIYAGRIFIFTGLFLIRDNPTALLVVAVLGGITLAGTGSMTSALTADIYGRFSVSSVCGLIFLVHQTGSALGSWLAGALFESTGGYGPAYVLACGLLLAAAIVALNIDKDARRIWRAATVSG